MLDGEDPHGSNGANLAIMMPLRIRKGGNGTRKKVAGDGGSFTTK